MPPAKRPRYFSRSDTSEFRATLSQRMLPGVNNYLGGGTLNILAVQVVVGDDLN